MNTENGVILQHNLQLCLICRRHVNTNCESINKSKREIDRETNARDKQNKLSVSLSDTHTAGRLSLASALAQQQVNTTSQAQRAKRWR